ncbi:MAG: hypothetical protein AAFX03_09310 [Pseudomonadota bacterium]
MADLTLRTLRRCAAIMTIGATGVLGACETATGSAQPLAPGPVSPAETGAVTGAGIHFPPPTSFEKPDIRFGPLAGAGPSQRQFFVDQVNIAAADSQRTISLVAQAVGDNRETLVFTIVGAEGEPTSYLARALLARMTSVVRFTPAITEMGLSEAFDIYNTAAVLGFQRIVVSDGRVFSHQADLARNGATPES